MDQRRWPEEKPLDGQVVVVIVWATWCGECHKKLPDVIAAHEAFAPQGVRFIGLTGEEPEQLAEITASIERLQVPWPNGYGAFDTLQKLRVLSTPTLLVVGRDGFVAWNNGGASSGRLADAIQAALDKK